MFASVGLGVFLLTVVLVRLAMRLWPKRDDDLEDNIVQLPEDLQQAIDRWDRIQTRHSHSRYWDE